MREIPQAHGAVLELMQEELDARPFGVIGEFALPQPEPQPPSVPSFRPPPPDWQEEAAERERQRLEEERQAREQEAAAKLAAEIEAAEQAERYPAPRKRRSWLTKGKP